MSEHATHEHAQADAAHACCHHEPTAAVGVHSHHAHGGHGAKSVFAPQFWTSFALAAPAGFLAAWPVNWRLLRKQIKTPCH